MQHCGQRTELRTFIRVESMSVLHAPQWPIDTPPDVRQLADQLAAVLKGRNGQVAGPATALLFAFLVAELGNAPLRQVIADVGALARRHGAMRYRRPH